MKTEKDERPLLQVALDHTDLESAIESARLLAPELDVLEAGTILCYAEGLEAVRRIRREFAQHIVLADLKVADAGGVVANEAFSSGADWMTVICCATIATIARALEVARNNKGDIQIELYGNWTFEEARQWRDTGIEQVVYHRSRDAAAAGQGWLDSDRDRIQCLSSMGFQVSVTGGLSPEDTGFFRDIPVKAFIAGRSLYAADNPVLAARQFREAIETFF